MRIRRLAEAEREEDGEDTSSQGCARESRNAQRQRRPYERKDANQRKNEAKYGHCNRERVAIRQQVYRRINVRAIMRPATAAEGSDLVYEDASLGLRDSVGPCLPD